MELSDDPCFYLYYITYLIFKGPMGLQVSLDVAMDILRICIDIGEPQRIHLYNIVFISSLVTRRE